MCERGDNGAKMCSDEKKVGFVKAWNMRVGGFKMRMSVGQWGVYGRRGRKGGGG